MTTHVLAARRSDVVPVGVYSHDPRIAGTPLGDVDLSVFVDRIRDQGQSEKCTGEGFSAGCHVANKGAGAHPSALGLYTGARARERKRRGDALLDVGAAIADVVAYSIEDGIYAEDDRDADNAPATVNQETKLDELMAEQTLGPSDVQRIDDGTRLASIVQSLREGAPVVFGMLIDQAYNDFDGSAPYAGMIGPSLGGHAQLIVGYLAGVFLVLNSWSRTWGRSGYGLLMPGAIAPVRKDVFDFYRINRAPILTAEAA